MAYWWVNQQQSYRPEREGGYMWAPLVNVAGQKLSHWESMELVRPGDVVFHHARGIRAIGIVAAAAQPSPMPPELPNMWDRDGRLVRVDYSDLPHPILADEIPIDRRIAERGPFASTGRVNQGYLYPLSTSLGEWLLEHFRDRVATVPLIDPSAEGGGVLPQDPALRRAVELYAVDRIVEALEAVFGAGTVRRMPANNKGYDIEVDRGAMPTLYVEAKGTQRMAPVFLLSEAERQFSADHSDRYELAVVWGIDLDKGAHAALWRRTGEVTAGTHGLVVQRWSGRLAEA